MKKTWIFLGLTILLFGCSIHPNTPQSAVSSALDAIASKDTWAFNAVTDSKLEDYILSDDNFLPDTSYMSDGLKQFYETLVPYIQSFDYTIDSVDNDSSNTRATVVITITNYDIATCLKDIQDEVIASFEAIGSTNIEDYYGLTISYFNDNIAQYFNLTHTVSLMCFQENQEWTVHIEDPSAFVYNLFAHNN